MAADMQPSTNLGLDTLELSSFLDFHRDALGWDDQSLARFAGISQSSLSAAKSNERATESTLNHLAIALARGYSVRQRIDEKLRTRLNDAVDIVKEDGLELALKWITNFAADQRDQIREELRDLGYFIESDFSKAMEGQIQELRKAIETAITNKSKSDRLKLRKGLAGRRSESFEDIEGPMPVDQLWPLLTKLYELCQHIKREAPKDPTTRFLKNLDPSRRTIRVGLFDWPGLCRGEHAASLEAGDLNVVDFGSEDYDDEHFYGPAKHITQLVCSMLGYGCEFVRAGWPEAFRGFESGRFDLIGPVYLALPVRLLHVRMSRNVPLISLPVAAVCRVEYADLWRDYLKGKTDDAASLRWLGASSEITRSLAVLLAGVDQVDRFEDAEVHAREAFAPSQPFSSIGREGRALLNSENDSKPLAFPTDALTAAVLVEQSRTSATPLLALVEAPKESQVSLGVSFAASTTDRLLIRQIDIALKVLEENPAPLKRAIRTGIRELIDRNKGGLSELIERDLRKCLGVPLED